jgi:hypothetical protein
MISRASRLADPITEDGAMAKVEEDVYERAARFGFYKPEELEWMRRARIRPALAPGSRIPTPVKQRPALLAFFIRLFRLDRDRFSEEGDMSDPMLDTGMPPLPDIDEVFERAARTGWYTPEQLESYRRNGIRPATGRATGLEEPVKQRPAWLAFIHRVFNLPDRD